MVLSLPCLTRSRPFRGEAGCVAHVVKPNSFRSELPGPVRGPGDKSVHLEKFAAIHFAL